MKQKKHIIGIDPDVEASGICDYDGDSYTLSCIPLWEVFGHIDAMWEYQLDGLGYKVEVLVEKSSSKNTWHKGGTGAARKVGANQEIASQIIKYCESIGVTVRSIEPKGYSSINHKKFCFITGWKEKTTNPEKRVAGLIAYNGYKGLI